MRSFSNCFKMILFTTSALMLQACDGFQAHLGSIQKDIDLGSHTTPITPSPSPSPSPSPTPGPVIGALSVTIENGTTFGEEQMIRVKVQNASGSVDDIIRLYDADENALANVYLNGRTEAPDVPILDATLDIPSPSINGDYEIRFFADDGDIAQASVVFLVAGITNKISTPLTNVKKIAGVSSTTCALTESGKVKCWGDSGYNFSSLGRPYEDDSAIAQDVLFLGGPAKDIAVGNDHACALLINGKVKCWGDGEDGKIGNGYVDSYQGSSIPVTVLGLEGDEVLEIKAIDDTSCALLAGGRLKCWGVVPFAIIANGYTSFPASVGTATDVPGFNSEVIKFAPGRTHLCAVFASGVVSCIGKNYVGELGNGTEDDAPSLPVNVVGLQGSIKEIYADDSYSCATLTDNRVQCWGLGYYGVLGLGNDDKVSTATIVPRLESKVFAAGLQIVCSVDQMNVITCAGTDGGRYGGDNFRYENTHTIVPGISLIPTALTIGSGGICALVEGGTVKCWGSNDAGELGNGTLLDRFANPLEVVSY